MEGQKIVTPRRKLLRRFYEPLLLLDALGQIRGERTKAASAVDDHGANHRKLRRSCTDGLAYIAAHKRHPDSVTAVALERTPESVTVWLAANSDVKSEVIMFLENVLRRLQQVAELDDLGGRRLAGTEISESFTTDILAFSEQKLLSYCNLIVSNYIQPCMEVLRTILNQGGFLNEEYALQLTNLERWLREHFTGIISSGPEGNTLERLVRACYEERHGRLFDTLRLLSGQGQQRHRDFEQLHKLLCKLGKAIAVSNRLIDAAVRLPQDFVDGFMIRVVKSSKYEKMPLKAGESTVQKIVRRMFSSLQEQRDFLSRLEFLRIGDDITEVIQEERQKKTRVHAELLLIDHFDRYGGTFLDANDRYIGCSKPACYLCYSYIDAHPGQYVLPATHQKIYLAWRVPDVCSGDPDWDKRKCVQEKILDRMIQRVRQDLKIEIESRTERRPFHADSTAGLTSTIQLNNEDNASILGGSWTSESIRQNDFSSSMEMEPSDYDAGNTSDDEGGVML